MICKPKAGDTVEFRGIRALVLEKTSGPRWQLKVRESPSSKPVWMVDAWFWFESGKLKVVSDE